MITRRKLLFTAVAIFVAFLGIPSLLAHTGIYVTIHNIGDQAVQEVTIKIHDKSKTLGAIPAGSSASGWIRPEGGEAGVELDYVIGGQQAVHDEFGYVEAGYTATANIWVDARGIRKVDWKANRFLWVF
jgi:hypothetical protein